MRVARGMGALAVLLVGIVGAPILLVTAAPLVGPGRLTDPGAWLRPDDGTVLLTLLWLLAWIVWAWFVALVVLEALGVGRRGGGGPRAAVASLLVAVLALGANEASAAPAPPSAVTATQPEHDDPVPCPPRGVRHEVRRGESLWSIAEHYYGDGAQWRAIADVNDLADPDELEIGAELVIPGVQRVEDPPPVVPVPGTAAAEPPDPEPAPPAAQPLPEPEASDATAVNPIVVPTHAATADDETAERTAARGALLLAGAHAGLLAGVGLGALWRRRREVQLALRPVGRRITHPDEGATALVAVADAVSVADLDQVLRAVGAHCVAVGVPVPTLRWVAVTDTSVRLCLDPAPEPPPWARVAGEQWVIDRQPAAPGTPESGTPESGTPESGTPVSENPAAQVPDAPALNPWPALWHIGQGHGGALAIDVEAGITSLAGVGVDAFVDGWILDAIASAWEDDVEVWVVGDHPGVRAAEVGHVHCVTESDVRGLATASAEPGDDDADTVTARRARRAAGQDAAPAHVIVCPHPLAPETWRAVRPLVAEGRVAVVTTEPVTTPIVVQAPPRFATLPDGTAFAARGIDPETADAVRSAFVAVSGAWTDEAWWYADADEPPTPEPAEPDRPEPDRLEPDRPEPDRSLPDNVIRIHPDRTTGRAGPLESVAVESVDVNTSEAIWKHPVVQVLGPVDVVGARGQTPSRARRSCVEMAAWLVEHPSATARQMVRDLLVAETTRRSNLSRLRQWLGRDDADEPYLPEAYGGRITLSGDVVSDWQQMQLLTLAGVNRTSTRGLIAALDLVRGAPLADAAPTQWQWAEVMRTDAASCIRDIAVELCGRALADGDVDLARWSAARAIEAVGDDELLLVARVRTEMRVGNHAEIPRLAMRLTRRARYLDVDLADDTITLLQEAMEGTVRGGVG